MARFRQSPLRKQAFSKQKDVSGCLGIDQDASFRLGLSEKFTPLFSLRWSRGFEKRALGHSKHAKTCLRGNLQTFVFLQKFVSWLLNVSGELKVLDKTGSQRRQIKLQLVSLKCKSVS